MKKIISVTLIIAAMLCFTSCGKKYDSEINVYNWGEYISDGSEGSLDVIKEFEKKYNIKVNYTTFDSNEDMYNILKAGGADYDVIIPSDYMIARLIEEGMLSKLNFDNIPNYSLIDDNYKNAQFDPNNEYSVPYTGGTVGIIYNTDIVKEPVDSWNILWDSKYAGQILMINNSRDAMAVAMKKLGIDPNSANKEDIDTAYNELLAQKPLLQKYVMDEVFQKMETNQAALAVYYAGDALTMMQNNDKLAFALPEEGTNKFIDSMCVPSNAKNKEGAEKFINFMCETEIAQANCEYIGYTTPHKEVYNLLSDEMKNNPYAYPDEEYLMEKCYYFANLTDDTYNYMQEKFLELLAK